VVNNSDIKIYIVDKPNDPGPASSFIKNKIMLVNAPVFYRLSHAERVNVLLHELAHIKHQTYNEKYVDAVAFDGLTKLGYNPAANFTALYKLRDTNNIEHMQRLAISKEKINMFNQYDMRELPANFIGGLYKKLFTTKEGRDRRQARRDERITVRNEVKIGNLANRTTLAALGIDSAGAKKQRTANQLGALAGAGTAIAGAALGAGGSGFALGDKITSAFTSTNEGGEPVVMDAPNASGSSAKILPDATANSKPWYKKTGVIVGGLAGVGFLVGLGIYIYKRNK
jgi:hypothetical protein